MRAEQEFFIQALADHLNKKATVIPGSLNWQALGIISRTQQLNGIIYCQCKNSIAQSDLPAEVKSFWRTGYLYNSFLYSKRLVLLSQIETEFQKENIAYVIVKGPEVAMFYPVPAQRTMGDLDILVHEEDKQKACEVLAKLGFFMLTQKSDEWHGFKKELVIELHHRLIYNHSIESEIIQAWGDRVWEHVTVQNNKAQRKLDLTYHLVYILLHLRKHLLENGVAFRQFMDVAVLAAQPEIDWKQAELWLKELRLIKFAQTCFAFCERWFNVHVPIGRIELEEEFYNTFTEKIFAGGIFGVNDKERKENAVFNRMHYTNSSGSGLAAFLKHAFLPYEELRSRTYCTFLNGRPYLLPVAWCWRLIYKVRTGTLIPLLKGAYGRKTVKKKEDMLTKWGL